MTKVSKASVRYRPADLPDVRCGTCVMFHPDGTCDLVAGAIDPGHVCDRWQPSKPLPSGHARENLAVATAMAVAAIFAAAEIAILSAIAWWVAKVLTGGLLATLAARRLRQTVTLILHDAETAVRQVLADAAKGIRADVERIIRSELTLPAGGAPPGLTSPGRLHPPGIPTSVIARVVAEILGRQSSARWHVLPSLLHIAGLNVLREADDIFRQVIADAMAVPEGSRLERAQAALDEFAEHGITAFTDAAGRNWPITAYVEMAIRTAASRMHLALQVDAMAAAGHDLAIIVHASPEPPCAKCVPWIGEVVSLSGMTPTGSDVSVTDAGGDVHTVHVAGSLAEATAAGLFHANCRCSAVLFADGADFPSDGISVPPGSAERYKAEQRLRAHERSLRRARRRQAVAGTPLARKAARERLAGARTRLQEQIKRAR